MTWTKELEELRRREALAEALGGPDKVAKQHGHGKMDARARLAALVDEGSFREIGKIAGSAKYDANGDLASITPAPFLFGKALINGRPSARSSRYRSCGGGRRAC
jgi:propionyl-CoA carboxylase beta chain